MLFERDEQCGQADAETGDDADALAQAAAVGHDVLGDAAARRARVAAVERSGGVDRGMIAFGMFGVHDGFSVPSPPETGKNNVWCLGQRGQGKQTSDRFAQLRNTRRASMVVAGQQKSAATASVPHWLGYCKRFLRDMRAPVRASTTKIRGNSWR